MENIVLLSSIFLVGMLILLNFIGKTWSSSFENFMFANRSLQVSSSALAISSHWFWAIAIFVGPATAYMWGIRGLLWFVIPNAISLLVVGFIASRVREKYPNGISLTQYVKENFSSRVSKLFQLEFVLIAFAALLLGFTAINKLWAFTNLSTIVEPIYASLAIGLITLAFTLRGGIRTSIFTGATQTILWTLFLSVLGYVLATSDLTFISLGKNNLESFFDQKFLTTFAITWFIAIIVGATSHGMMWQKSFSMAKENIMPSFSIAAVFFAAIVFALGSLGMVAFGNGVSVIAPDVSQMVMMQQLLGPVAIVIFGIILIGQTSTVMDSSLNYIASLVSVEWLHKEEVSTSRTIMAVFMVLAWLVSWAKLEIWTILMLMGAVRITMFVPLALHALRFNQKEAVIFYASTVAIIGSFYLAWVGKMDKLPVFDMYSALLAIGLPLLSFSVFKLSQLNKT